MTHNPLTLNSLGYLAPEGGGAGVNVPVTSLKVNAADGGLSANLAVTQVGVGVQDRTPISAIDNSKRLLIEVSNG